MGVPGESSGVAGWLPGARHVASPNHDERPAGTIIDLVVLHAISLPPDEFGGPYVEALFTNRLDPRAHPYFADLESLRVSAHFFIDRGGALTQFVPLGARAWHAGVSRWQGRERCNDFSVGIELEGCDTRPFEDAQYATLARLLAELFARLPALGRERVVGHSDVAPGRKTDPGPCFDWGRARRDLPR